MPKPTKIRVDYRDQMELELDLQERGYRIWNDHPGYTIDALNSQLSQYRLMIETYDVGDTIYYKIVKTK